MGFHGGMSEQLEGRRSTATHRLDGISWWNVSDSNGGQGHTATYPLNEISWQHVSNHAQAIPRRRTETHRLDGISWRHVSDPKEGQGAHDSQAAWGFMAHVRDSITSRLTATHLLDIG